MSPPRLPTEKSAGSREAARESRPGPKGGWRTPFKKGEGQHTGYRKPSAYTETLQLARPASPAAMRVLIERLSDPDGRIALTSASLILERTWGKVKEAKEEPQPEAHVDLSQLTAAILAKLVDSGRLGGAETRSPPQIEDPVPDIE
jgi:hypothetical protein